MRRLLSRSLCLLVLAGCVLGPAAAPAHAKLSGAEWKEAEQLFNELFSQRGNPKGKASIVARIMEDGTSRAWRKISQALLDEVLMWSAINKEYVDASNEHSAVLHEAGTDGYTREQEKAARKLQRLLKLLEQDARDESAALQAVVLAVTEGPVALRKIILQRAKGGDDWPYRAAAIRVAVASMEESNSRSFLAKALVGDKDPRVRLAGLDALASAPENWEALVLGRLTDPDWGVVLRATRILEERDAKSAVPHLINALPRASPRLAQAIGKALGTLTGENFEPYADIWGKWWAEHKGDFNSKVAIKKGRQKEFANLHVYGVPIKSDSVLFIVDISGSMKLKTKNDNPLERWKPPPVVTGGRAPPPPPPPEEILSGPKIDVALHEMQKAIKSLGKDDTFNIIAFNTGLKRWKDTMVKASKKNKETAYTWIRSLRPSGATYVDGALKDGFSMAGLINFDSKYPEIMLDTMVLISDGAPTDNSMPAAKLMSTELILEHVRVWNKDKKVIIHCIGVDIVEPVIQFLKDLADENGGTYVDR